MVDKKSRKILVTALNQLMNGEITNYEFENYDYNLKDTGIREILDAVWYLYDDSNEYKMTGQNQFDTATNDYIEHLILFCESDQEYEWPQISVVLVLLNIFLNIITLGIWSKFSSTKKLLRHVNFSNEQYWPFISKEQYDFVLKNKK